MSDFQRWADWYDDTRPIDPERWFVRMVEDVELPEGRLDLYLRFPPEGSIRHIVCGEHVKVENIEIDADNDSLWLDGAWHTGRTEIVKALERVFGGGR